MKNEECPFCGQMKNFSSAQEKFFNRHMLNSSLKKHYLGPQKKKDWTTWLLQ